MTDLSKLCLFPDYDTTPMSLEDINEMTTTKALMHAEATLKYIIELVNTYEEDINNNNETVSKLKEECENYINEIQEGNKTTREILSDIQKWTNEHQDILTITENIKELYNTKATQQELKATNARIDSFTRLEQGSTTGDAELIDGRNGADGTVYANIGDAIREQIKDVLSDAKNIYFNGYISESLIYEDNTLDSKGEEKVDSTWKRTGFLYSKEYEGMKVEVNSGESNVDFYYYLYNSDKKMISYLRMTDSGIINIKDSVYIRFTVRKNINKEQLKLYKKKNVALVEDINEINNKKLDEEKFNEIKESLGYTVKLGRNKLMSEQFENKELNISNVDYVNDGLLIKISPWFEINDSTSLAVNVYFNDGTRAESGKGTVKYLDKEKNVITWYGLCTYSNSSYPITSAKYVLIKFKDNTYEGKIISGIIASENGELPTYEKYNEKVILENIEVIKEKLEKEENKIPDYFKSQYTEKIEKINNLLDETSNCESFVLIADVHVNSNSLSSSKLIYNILKDTNVQKVIFLGDICRAYGSKEDALSDVNYFKNNYMNYERLYVARGNHDITIRKEQDSAEGYTAKTSLEYNRVFRKYENLYNSHGKTYYYFDEDSTKIRHIILDTNEETRDSETAPWGVLAGMSQTQVDWLIEIMKSTPKEYDIIIGGHIPVNSNITWSLSKLYFVSELVDAFNNKTSISKTTTEGLKIEADFSSNINSKVLLVTNGHGHLDMSYQDDNKCLYYSIGCDACLNDDTNVPRKRGTIRESLFDVFLINRDTGELNCIRFGAGEDKQFTL